MMKLSCIICMLIFCLSASYSLATLSNQQVENRPSRKSRILIIGATGSFGRYVVEASARARHPTVALVRTKPTDPGSDTAQLISNFTSWGVSIVYGDFNIDRKIVVKTMKRVDVVISCVGGTEVPTQANITSAILQAGNIKRFLPSEYAIDVDRVHDPVEPAKSMFAAKAAIRRSVEALGIPHTFVVANGFAGRFWPNLAQVNPEKLIPDIHNVVAYGTGNSMIIATAEEDVATYVIKTVDDPRTLNKILYLRPPANILSYNQLFDLWEKKSGATLNRTYISEQELLQSIQDLVYPENILPSICYSVAIKNDYASYRIDPLIGVEASKRYPEVKYQTVSAYFDQVLDDANADTFVSLLSSSSHQTTQTLKPRSSNHHSDS